MSDENASLRTEIERMLADALAADKRHIADTERRDELHMNELERRDERHLKESVGRDDVHLHELQIRGDLHEHELAALRGALESRDLMGQAKGVIMASMGCLPDDAFKLIVKQSQHENRKATEVAAEIVQRAIKRPHPPRAG